MKNDMTFQAACCEQIFRTTMHFRLRARDTRQRRRPAARRRRCEPQHSSWVFRGLGIFDSGPVMCAVAPLRDVAATTLAVLWFRRWVVRALGGCCTRLDEKSYSVCHLAGAPKHTWCLHHGRGVRETFADRRKIQKCGSTAKYACRVVESVAASSTHQLFRDLTVAILYEASVTPLSQIPLCRMLE
ncbi:hypothetical protein HYPSUDRAFT_605140 [Hypholoma sublateritium FD-334 SS-4]|uniref:Uncharacterized protein n=1 Tax=Hypholoma sublateritium (strain FD-334 SS-4) TaxID=945553 RepID=A0A0D2N1G2_HYPSF|nr:hypothetical protein HYPSUDRAFT_605140 [Hypholoma sublateritium FD-334 SS-4]